MKKILIFLAIAFASIFVGMFGYYAYSYYQALHIDDPIDPYLWVEIGQSTLVRGDVAFDVKEQNEMLIQEWDTIITNPHSEASIFWPDRSITRLGADSQFVVHKMRVAQDYSKIEIEASLLNGKVYSNITRTLYPGSHITINIPSEKIIAGVRGTEFSINLEKGYIHSIDHVVSIKRKILNVISQEMSLVFPGEIVAVTDIFQKLTKDVLDASWETLSQIQNNKYLQEHTQNIEKMWLRLTWEFSKNNYFDIVTRKILSFIPRFQDLTIVQRLQSLDINKITEVPKDSILRWYQTMKFWNFAKERDFIRGAIYEVSKIDNKFNDFLQILATESLWDITEFPALDLHISASILQDVTNSTIEDVQSFIKDFSIQKYQDETINSIQKLFTFPSKNP